VSALDDTEDLVRALGGEDAALALYRALSPAARRAIGRIADTPGEDDPPPSVCVAIALDEGARPEVVLAAIHAVRPATEVTDPEILAALEIGEAIDATDPDGAFDRHWTQRCAPTD